MTAVPNADQVHRGTAIWVVIVAIILLFSQFPAKGQDQPAAQDTFDIRSAAYYLPVRTPFKDFRHLITVTGYILPPDWTLYSINAPMVGYSARYSLPAGFSVEGGLSTLIVATRITAGPRWTYSINNLHFGASYFYGFNFGVLNEFGFSTQITGWSHLPTFTAGYAWKKTSLTLNMGLEYLGNFSYKTGSNVVTSRDGGYNLNGSMIGLTLEQRYKRNKVITFGFTMNHVNYLIVVWPAYPVNQKRYFVPEINVGIVLP